MGTQKITVAMTDEMIDALEKEKNEKDKLGTLKWWQDNRE